MDMTQLAPLAPTEIRSVIQKSAPFGGEVWQSMEIERPVMQITKLQVEIHHNKFIIHSDDQIGLNDKKPIFVRLRYRNTIFKIDPANFKFYGDRIVCDFPNEARAIQERKGDRYVLSQDAGISMSLKRMERSIREVVLDLEVRVVDVSERGFGIMISGTNRNFLKRLDHFWIKAIDQRPLDYYIFGKVCYVAPRKAIYKQGDVRLGLAIEAPIGKDMFEYLKNKSNLILTS